MDHGDLSYPPDEPPRPGPFVSELSDEDVAEFQRLLKEHCGEDLSLDAASARAWEMLQLVLILLDPDRFERWLEELHTSARRQAIPPQPRTPPTPEPFPIPLEDPHLQEVIDHLRIVSDELRSVQRRPGLWRAVLVSLYKALGHALVFALQPTPPQPEGEGLGHLTALYRAARQRWPHLPNCQEAVEEIERIRTMYVRLSIGDWPVKREKLPELVARARLLLRSLPITDPGWARIDLQEIPPEHPS